MPRPRPWRAGCGRRLHGGRATFVDNFNGISCHILRCRMPTRNVVLTKHQEKLLKMLVSSGRYQNASEVLRAGLRLVEKREAEDAAKLKALRKAAQAGFAA